jgi:exopolysaccharide biosynthesis polyprenyl glycosylphosphotransferase
MQHTSDMRAASVAVPSLADDARPSSKGIQSTRPHASPRGRRSRRSRVVRLALVLADFVGVAVAFGISMLLFPPAEQGRLGWGAELGVFLGTMPAWLTLFRLHGLYERDDERADHSTIDEVAALVQVAALGVLVLEVVTLVTGLIDPEPARLVTFAGLVVVLVTSCRGAARLLVRRLPSYRQRVLLVGGGDVGQLVARKIQQHPEYGLDLLGCVDDNPKTQRRDVSRLTQLGGLAELPRLVDRLEVDRIIVAFSGEPDAGTMHILRSLVDEVTIDVVPRLYDLVGPRASMHHLEGLSLVCLPPSRIGRLPLLVKRVIDLLIAVPAVVALLPLFTYAAYRIKRESTGPVFFRQERLGMNQRPFTALKFRTMKTDTDQGEHRDYIKTIMTAQAALSEDGIYKLRRDDAITPFGRFLRETSLDEVPQLLNVIRGDMSIVGPRPCIAYETEFFAPHHYERFVVPQGITGLWQVTARANSTFGEALDMDVSYVRGWTLGLDLRLMFRTPFALLRQRRSTT